MTNSLLIYGLNICAFPHIIGSPSSYIIFNWSHLNFLIYEDHFVFFFYQCAILFGMYFNDILENTKWVWMKKKLKRMLKMGSFSRRPDKGTEKHESHSSVW
jgi:hypothetical protein